MKEEILKINQMVAEGKLSPEDAADLIEVITRKAATPPAEPPPRETPPPPPGNPTSPPPPPPGYDADSPKDPFRAIFDEVSRVGKKIADKLDDSDIGDKAKGGFESIRQKIEDVTKSGFGNNWFASSESREQSLNFSISAGQKVTIDNPVGSVRVNGGALAPMVKASIRAKAATIEEARQRADAYQLIVEDVPSGVTIRQPDLVGVIVDLVVEVPMGTETDVRSESGDVDLRATRAATRVTTKSGAVRVDGAENAVEITTDSGDVNVIDQNSGSVSVESKSGTVRLHAVQGSASVRTAQGAIAVSDFQGRILNLESVAGPIDAGYEYVGAANVNLRNVNAPIKLRLPSGVDARVALSTLKGTITCEVPIEDQHRDATRLTGRLGEGTGAIDVSAVTGDVWVSSRDASG